jgi:GTP-binding protein HflX
VVALVGYTNAGKSTLLNALSKSEVRAENVLFATLDPTTRVIALPEGRQVLLTDTVGFIQRLPTQLVAAFRATLEEIQDADLLIHVLDLTHPNAEEQSETVDRVLGELGVGDKPRIVALNKIDRLFPNLVTRENRNGNVPDPILDTDTISARIVEDLGLGEGYVPISAEQQWGLDSLLKSVQDTLGAGMVQVRVLIPYSKSELVALFHAKGMVEQEEHKEDGTLIHGRLPDRYAATFGRYSL